MQAVGGCEMQTPPWQTGVAAPQTLPQVPQLSTSFERFTQVVPQRFGVGAKHAIVPPISQAIVSVVVETPTPVQT